MPGDAQATCASASTIRVSFRSCAVPNARATPTGRVPLPRTGLCRPRGWSSRPGSPASRPPKRSDGSGAHAAFGEGRLRGPRSVRRARPNPTRLGSRNRHASDGAGLRRSAGSDPLPTRSLLSECAAGTAVFGIRSPLARLSESGDEGSEPALEIPRQGECRPCTDRDGRRLAEAATGGPASRSISDDSARGERPENRFRRSRPRDVCPVRGFGALRPGRAPTD